MHHPLCEDNISKSQDDIQYVIHHASMPKSRDLPECGSILDDDTIDYTTSDDNVEDDNIYCRQTYIPPESSPLGIYLNNMKKKILKCSILKEQQIISPKSSPIPYLCQIELILVASKIMSYFANVKSDGKVVEVNGFLARPNYRLYE